MDLEARYPFETATDTKVAPDLVDEKIYGDFYSFVKGSVRIWKFETAENRDQFQNAVDNGFFQRTHK